MPNKLNDLEPKAWLKFQKSWFIHNPPPRRKGVLVHPAKFPETMAQEFIEFFTKKGETVLDPMAGTGSTLVAALRAGRNSYGIELNPKYAKIAEQIIDPVGVDPRAVVRHPELGPAVGYVDPHVDDALAVGDRVAEQDVDRLADSALRRIDPDRLGDVQRAATRRGPQPNRGIRHVLAYELREIERCGNTGAAVTGQVQQLDDGGGQLIGVLDRLRDTRPGVRLNCRGSRADAVVYAAALAKVAKS